MPPPCPLDDLARLAAFRAGQPAALAAVYRHHLPRVARILTHGCQVRTATGMSRVPGLSSVSDVEGGCHDVFLKAFAPKARAAFQGGPYWPYLARIARNWLIDRFRRLGRLEPTDEVPEQVTEPEVDADVDRQRLAHELERFLDEQPPQHQRWYRLRFRQDHTQQQAAEALGLTRIQGRRIEAKLRDALRRHMLRTGHLEMRR